MKQTKKYSIKIEVVDGKSIVTRENDGFNVLELLGILENIQLDILKQISGEIKPDVIKRQVIDPNE